MLSVIRGVVRISGLSCVCPSPAQILQPGPHLKGDKPIGEIDMPDGPAAHAAPGRSAGAQGLCGGRPWVLTDAVYIDPVSGRMT